MRFLLFFNIFPRFAFFCLLEENSAVSCTLSLCILFLKLIHVETVHKHSALEKAAESSPAPKPSAAGVHVPELHRWASISCSGALRLTVTYSRSLWLIKILNNNNNDNSNINIIIDKYFSFLISAKALKLSPVLTHFIIKTKKMKTHSTIFSNSFTILHVFLKNSTLCWTSVK